MMAQQPPSVDSKRKRRRVRVGIDAGLAFGQRPTGVGYFSRSLLNACLEQIPELFQVFLYCPPAYQLHPRLTTNSERITIRSRPEFHVKLIPLWWGLWSWLDRLDLFYTTRIQYPLLAKGRKICTFHDTIFEEYPECYPAGQPAYFKSVFRQALKHCSGAVVNSNSTATNLRHYFGTSKPLIVVEAAARSEFQPGNYQPPAAAALRQLQPPYLLFVGRIDRRKNAHVVVQAYRRVISEGHQCSLVLVGPDDTGSPLLQEALKHGRLPNEHIVQTGYVDDVELVNLYRGAAAFVYPSLAEGFGLPVLEAMSCGTPTITSDRGALKEVAGDAALLVNPESSEQLAAAMRKVVTQPHVAAQFAAAGLRRAAEFSWQASAARLWAGFTSLVEKE